MTLPWVPWPPGRHWAQWSVNGQWPAAGPMTGCSRDDATDGEVPRPRLLPDVPAATACGYAR